MRTYIITGKSVELEVESFDRYDYYCHSQLFTENTCEKCWESTITNGGMVSFNAESKTKKTPDVSFEMIPLLSRTRGWGLTRSESPHISVLAENTYAQFSKCYSAIQNSSGYPE